MTACAIDSCGVVDMLIDITRSGTAIRRLLAAGLIREATEKDREEIAGMRRVSHANGATIGSGEFLLAKLATTVYRACDGFSAGDVDRAMTAMYERELREHNQDVLDRVLSTYGDDNAGGERC